MQRTQGIILALISSGTFGLVAFFSITLMHTGLNTPSLILYRSLFATLLLGIICLIRKRNFKISKRIFMKLAALGVTYILTMFGLIYSYNFISSGIATTIHFLYPIIVALIMTVVFKEKVSPTIFVASAFSLVGVAFLCWSGNQFVDIRGVLSVSITVVTYAIYIASFSSKDLKNMPPEIATFYVLLTGTIVLSIVVVLSGKLVPIPSFSAGANLLLFAFLTTVMSGLALVKAVQLAGSTITSVLGSMEPLVATVIGIVYFKEPFGRNSIFGFFLIIFSVTIVVLINNRKEKKARKASLNSL